MRDYEIPGIQNLVGYSDCQWLGLYFINNLQLSKSLIAVTFYGSR